MKESPTAPGGEAASPATSILQSTERVASVIVNTLSRNRNTLTISRPNLGKHPVMHDDIERPGNYDTTLLSANALSKADVSDQGFAILL